LSSVREISAIIKGLAKRRKEKEKEVAVLVDGPNILRKDLSPQVDLSDIFRIASNYGRIRVAKVILNKYASDKLIDAVSNTGFTPIVTPGKVEVSLTMEAMDLINNEQIDVIVFVVRDAGYAPLLALAKERGKDVVVIGSEPGFSVALRKTADETINLSEIAARA